MHILLRLVMSNVLLRRIACADELDVLSVTELHQNSGSFERAASRSRSAPKSPVDAWQADTVTTAAAGLDEGLGRISEGWGGVEGCAPCTTPAAF